MNHTRTQEINGTSLQGYTETTRADLTRAFGEPIWYGDHTEKVTIEWGVLFADGTLATVYDWKRYTEKELGADEVYQYHIGGESAHAVELIEQALNEKAGA
jgi:hypothetical protein